MLLPDVSVRIYAHRVDSSPDHLRYAAWLTDVPTGSSPFALSALAVVALVRIVTNPRVFRTPSTLGEARAFLNELLRRPRARPAAPAASRARICNVSRHLG